MLSILLFILFARMNKVMKIAHAVSDTRNLAAGRQLDLLSTQYTARCAATNTSGYGCCRGYPITALEHYRNTGVATDVCLPYNELSSLPLPEYGRNYKAEYPLTCFFNLCRWISLQSKINYN